MSETIPAGRAQSVAARAHNVVSGGVPSGSVQTEARFMANAVLLLIGGLERARAADRSEAYKPGERLPDGTAPAAVEGKPGTWRTPREIAGSVLGPDSKQGDRDGQEADTT